MQLFGKHVCRTFEDQPMARLFLFTQNREAVIGVKISAKPENDRLEGFRSAPPNMVGHVVLSATPRLFFASPTNKLVLDIEDNAIIVPDLQATAPKVKHAPGILFMGKGKTYLSVAYKTTHQDETVGDINIATGEFERHLVMDVELAIASWGVVLANPMPGIDVVRYALAA
jgi:hypothetical protein